MVQASCVYPQPRGRLEKHYVLCQPHGGGCVCIPSRAIVCVQILIGVMRVFHVRPPQQNPLQSALNGSCAGRALPSIEAP